MNKNFVFFSWVSAFWVSLSLSVPVQAALSPCPDFAQTGQARLIAEAECGHLSVPLDDRQPNKTIDLNIVRWPSISTAPASDPLFVLAGGPGQAATEIGWQLQSFLRRVRKKRDIVFFDQRGTGLSHPLECSLFESDDGSKNDDEIIQVMSKRLEQCFGELFQDGIRPDYFSTAHSAQDIDRVRAYLGYQRINLWGGSYGSRLALAYARDFPNSLRSMVLDGVAPAVMRLPETMASDIEGSFVRLVEDCAQQLDCARLGNLNEQFTQVAERLLNESLWIQQQHPRSGELSRFLLTPKKFLGAVRMALYNRETSVMLPWVIARAHSGDYQPLATLLMMVDESGLEQSIALGLHYAIICQEDWRAESLSSPVNGPFGQLDLTQGYQLACETLYPNAKPEQFDQPKSALSNVPTLLLSGRRDPATPPKRALKASKNLSQFKHLIAPGGHHIVSNLGCLPRIIEAFYQTPKPNEINAECVQKIKPMSNFVSPVWVRLNNQSSSDAPSADEPVLQAIERQTIKRQAIDQQAQPKMESDDD